MGEQKADQLPPDLDGSVKHKAYAVPDGNAMLSRGAAAGRAYHKPIDFLSFRST